MPELAYDLGGGEVAIEPLLAGRAKEATHCAACLSGNAQRSAVVFRNEHRLHCVAVAHIKEPLAGAVGRMLDGNDRRRFDVGQVMQLGPKALGQIAHCIKVVLAVPMHPAGKLNGTIGLFSEFGAPRLDPLNIKVEQIHAFGRLALIFLHSVNPALR